MVRYTGAMVASALVGDAGMPGLRGSCRLAGGAERQRGAVSAGAGAGADIAKKRETGSFDQPFASGKCPTYLGIKATTLIDCVFIRLVRSDRGWEVRSER